MTVVASIVFVSFFAVLSIAAENDEFKIVHTEYGSIRGKLLSTVYDDKPFYSYRGIPYAKPPLNELRYKPPKSPIAWSNILDTFEYGNVCVQKSLLANNLIFGNEDCLYLNVFTPVTKSNEKLPVMVWIHGGGYMEGSSNEYRPDFLLNNDVIVVTINYRLGPIGFLSLGTADYSGNNGLKDQLFALQWVQRNIEQFGGDKDLVTIFGESAGSASVHFHVLAPKSQGLFKRAIMQSGSVVNPWASHSKSDHLDNIHKLAKRFGHNPKSANDLVDFVNRVDPLIFTGEAITNFYVPGSARKGMEIIWGPIVEVANAKEPFLTKTPQEYLDDKSMKQTIDTLHGFCSAEMIFLTAPEVMNPSLLTAFNEKLEFQFPRKDLPNDFESKDYQSMVQDIRNFYFKKSNGQIDKDTVVDFNNLLSDSSFVYGVNAAVRSQVKRTTGNVFYYKFSLDTKLNILKKGIGQLTAPTSEPFVFPGASHAEDLFYLFYFDMPNVNFSQLYASFSEDSIERKSIKMVTKLWTDFAKYGNPTPNAVPIDFKPVRKNVINFVDITNDGLVGGNQPFAERIAFWNTFYKKYEKLLRKNLETRKDEL